MPRQRPWYNFRGRRCPIPDLPTRLDLYALGRDYVVQRATRVDPAQVDAQGSDVNLVVGIGAVMTYQVVKQLGYRTAALTLDGSEGEDLDRYVWDKYQTSRKGASPARGAITISRLTTAAGAGDVPAGTTVVTDTNIEYITTTPATLGASDLVTVANVRASNAGKATQVGKLAIKRFSKPGSLFDKTLVATNPLPTAGGEDAENDETLRDRVRDFWRTARRGILPAIEFGAKQVLGVVSAQAIEVLTEGAQPARLVQLFIADSTGVSSDALAEEVRVALEDFRGGGIQVLVITSVPLLVGIQLKLRFRANVSTNIISASVRAAVVEFVNSVAVNATLYRSDLFSVLRRYVEDGLIVLDDTIVVPVGDLVPSTGQTIRTTLADVVFV